MSWDHFEDQLSNVKPNILFKQLPILELDDGNRIRQSVAIFNYIEAIANISIADPVRAAEASSILQSAQELFVPLSPDVNSAVDDDFETKRLAMRTDLERRFYDLERYLHKYDGKYFIDEIFTK